MIESLRTFTITIQRISTRGPLHIVDLLSLPTEANFEDNHKYGSFCHECAVPILGTKVSEFWKASFFYHNFWSLRRLALTVGSASSCRGLLRLARYDMQQMIFFHLNGLIKTTGPDLHLSSPFVVTHLHSLFNSLSSEL